MPGQRPVTAVAGESSPANVFDALNAAVLVRVAAVACGSLVATSFKARVAGRRGVGRDRRCGCPGSDHERPRPRTPQMAGAAA